MEAVERKRGELAPKGWAGFAPEVLLPHNALLAGYVPAQTARPIAKCSNVVLVEYSRVACAIRTTVNNHYCKNCY